MLPLLVHYCTACAYSTPVPFSASVFSQNHSCNHCGAVSVGLNSAPSQDNETHQPSAAQQQHAQEQQRRRREQLHQAEMQQQDELAHLFTGLTFSPHAPPQPHEQPPPADPTPPPPPEHHHQTPDNQPITYISQHYTHSAHIPRASTTTSSDAPIPPAPAPAQASASASTSPSPIPSPISDASLTDIQMAHLLSAHAVDPAALFPTQIELFRRAPPDQRARLLELWRIAPPRYYGGRSIASASASAGQADGTMEWPRTSLALEEDMARVRWERERGAGAAGRWGEVMEDEQVADRGPEVSAELLADAEVHPGIAGGVGANDNASNPSAAAAAAAAAEPYIVSGYEALARRDYEEQAGRTMLGESTRYNQATDPAFNRVAGGWGGGGGGGGGGGEWQKNTWVQGHGHGHGHGGQPGGMLMDMENQYGSFAAAREGGDGDVMMM